MPAGRHWASCPASVESSLHLVFSPSLYWMKDELSVGLQGIVANSSSCISRAFQVPPASVFSMAWKLTKDILLLLLSPYSRMTERSLSVVSDMCKSASMSCHNS